MQETQKTLGILDDEPMWRRVVGRVFEARGDKVIEIAQARELDAHLDELDALCIDLSVAGANGFELIARFHKERPELPIFVVTADARVDSVVRAMRLGVVDYVTKPAEQARISEAADRMAEAASCQTVLTGLNELPTLDVIEKRAIDCALTLTKGQVSQAARMLGIGRATLYRKLAEMGRHPRAPAPPTPPTPPPV